MANGSPRPNFKLTIRRTQRSQQSTKSGQVQYGVQLEDGVPEAVYEHLGTGIPQHVQWFFARLQRFAATTGKGRLEIDDVDAVYRKEMLGPAGQGELLHYETRLRDALGDDTSYEVASTILAEAATSGMFANSSRRVLEDLYSDRIEKVEKRIGLVLDILVYDGYLRRQDDGYVFLSKWLKDWWFARCRDHYEALDKRGIGY